jgi:aldehyde:ferredoxin oxidoreductase
LFATGPLQGLNVAGGGRYVVLAKSPKTKSVSDSYVGGFLAHELGGSGYDGIIIKGRASSPKYITLIKGEAKIWDAKELWGLYTAETEEHIRKIHGNVRVACIGPAGENMVKFACIISDRNRSAGRPGFGAVMGSKNLKAIAVGGGIEKPLHNEAKFKRVRGEFAKNLAADPGMQRLGEYGTAGGVNYLNALGILPTKNFQEGVFEGAERISGEILLQKLAGRDSCTACPVRCKRVVKTEPKYGGPEYETIASFGSFLLNDDLDAIIVANQKCNSLGLDTISTGVVIAWAIEACERGVLDLNLRWGDPEAILNLIDQIAFRKGIGDELARGIDYLAKQGDFAMQIKGQEIPMHEPRGKVSLGLTYATSPRGATHLEGIHDTMLEIEYPTPELGIRKMDRFQTKGKPKVAKIYEDLRSFTNSCILCVFVTSMTGKSYNYPQIREMINSACGLEIDVEEMLRIGERNYNLLKILAVREGYTRKDDDLPKRLKEALPKGASAGRPIPDKVLQQMIDEYYNLRGWDEYGPTDQKLRELDLEEFVGLIPRP